MGRNHKLLFAVCLLGLIFTAACSTTVGLVGYDPKNDEVLRGTVTMSFIDGTGSVKGVGEKSGVKVEGPAFFKQGTGSNRTGVANVQAEDGRLFKAEWVTKTLTSGFGSGQDQFGNPFIFAFGLTPAEETQFITRQRQLHGKE